MEHNNNNLFHKKKDKLYFKNSYIIDECNDNITNITNNTHLDNLSIKKNTITPLHYIIVSNFIQIFSKFISIIINIIYNIHSSLSKIIKIKYSLADTVLILGIVITTLSFKEYFSNNEISGISSLGFIYGIPITLIGSSLKYAELLPVPLYSTENVDIKFQKYATSTMKQILFDTTRYIYGNHAHLDISLKKLKLISNQNTYPELKYIYLEDIGINQVSMLLVFKSLDTPYRIWNERLEQGVFNRYFGPNVICELLKIDSNDKLLGIKITNMK